MSYGGNSNLFTKHLWVCYEFFLVLPLFFVFLVIWTLQEEKFLFGEPGTYRVSALPIGPPCDILQGVPEAMWKIWIPTTGTHIGTPRKDRFWLPVGQPNRNVTKDVFWRYSFFQDIICRD